MKALSIALLGAATLALGACGGPSEETVADNAVNDTLVVPEDDLLAPVDNSLVEVPAGDLGDETNTVDAGNLSVDANVAADTNAQ